MTFTLTINADNDAFEGEDTGSEIARILRKVANKVDGSTENDLDGGALHDLNGNKVGRWDFSD